MCFTHPFTKRNALQITIYRLTANGTMGNKVRTNLPISLTSPIRNAEACTVAKPNKALHNTYNAVSTVKSYLSNQSQ